MMLLQGFEPIGHALLDDRVEAVLSHARQPVDGKIEQTPLARQTRSSSWYLVASIVVP